jgi:hypothetical protein
MGRTACGGPAPGIPNGNDPAEETVYRLIRGEATEEERRLWKRIALVVLPIAAILVFFNFGDWISDEVCAPSEMIQTPEAALAFGRNYIREQKNFWEGLEVSPAEKEKILTQDCCTVSKGDYFIGDRHRRWDVHMGGQTTSGRQFTYDLFFGRCKRDPRPEKLIY